MAVTPILFSPIDPIEHQYSHALNLFLEKKFGEARDSFEQIITTGDRSNEYVRLSIMRISEMYSGGHGVEQNLDYAEKLLLEQLDSGESSVYLFLGTYYANFRNDMKRANIILNWPQKQVMASGVTGWENIILGEMREHLTIEKLSHAMKKR